MEIKKATFDCTIAMPGYANVKPGASEIVLAPGEQIEDAWTELDRRAKAWHRKEYPHLYEERETAFYLPKEVIKSDNFNNPDKVKANDLYEFDASLAQEIAELRDIEFKEDAEEWMAKAAWRKYNPVLKSMVNAKPNKS